MFSPQSERQFLPLKSDPQVSAGRFQRRSSLNHIHHPSEGEHLPPPISPSEPRRRALRRSTMGGGTTSNTETFVAKTEPLAAPTTPTLKPRRRALRRASVGGLPEAPTTPATPSSTYSAGRRKFSSKLLDRLSVFEAPVVTPNGSDANATTTTTTTTTTTGEDSRSPETDSPRKKTVSTRASLMIQKFESPIIPQKVGASSSLLSVKEVKQLIQDGSNKLSHIVTQYEQIIDPQFKLQEKEKTRDRQRQNLKHIKRSKRNIKTKRDIFRDTHPEEHASNRGVAAYNNAGDHTRKNVFTTVCIPPLHVENFAPPVFAKAEMDRELIIHAVQHSFVFSVARHPDTLQTVVEAFEPVVSENVIVEQGATSDHFYIVQEGTVEFQVHGETIGTAQRGDSFGEQNLLHPAPANATVVARGTAKLLRLDAKDFRGIVVTQTQRADEAKRNLLLGIDFLQELLQKDTDLTNKLVSLLEGHEMQKDHVWELDEDETFAMVKNGTFQVQETNGGTVIDPGLNAGEYFGERALLGLKPRNEEDSKVTMTALSSEPSMIYSMTRTALEHALGQSRVQQLKDIQGIANQTSLLADADISKQVMDNLATKIVETTLEQDMVVEEHHDEPALYVVREGAALVQYENDHGEIQEKTVAAGGVFGEEAVVKTETIDGKTQFRRRKGFTASTLGGAPVTLGVLPLQEIESALTIPEEEPFDAVVDSITHQLQAKIREAVRAGIALEDLERISLLGEGQFGEVWLVSADVFQTGVESLKQKFALKSQYKDDDVRGEEAVDAIRNEIKVMEAVLHPNIADLVNTYEDEKCIYMLMGLIPGGELWDVIHKEGDDGVWSSGIPEDGARFYSLVVADTLAFMHSRNYVFRDLKPENIMIDSEGYPVIVDFGFTKYCDGKTFTFCGTPNYVAPEIVSNKGHNRAVDYWAFGVTLYEMLTGENPFYYDGMDQVSLYDAICNGEYYPFPHDKTPREDLVEMMDGLLAKEPESRLGMLAGGSKDIVHHKWYSPLDLQEVRAKRYPAPWIPHSEEVDETAAQELLDEIKKDKPILEPPLTSSGSIFSHSSNSSLPSLGVPNITEEDEEALEEELAEMEDANKLAQEAEEEYDSEDEYDREARRLAEESSEEGDLAYEQDDFPLEEPVLAEDTAPSRSDSYTSAMEGSVGLPSIAEPDETAEEPVEEKVAETKTETKDVVEEIPKSPPPLMNGYYDICFMEPSAAWDVAERTEVKVEAAKVPVSEESEGETHVSDEEIIEDTSEAQEESVDEQADAKSPATSPTRARMRSMSDGNLNEILEDAIPDPQEALANMEATFKSDSALPADYDSKTDSSSSKDGKKKKKKVKAKSSSDAGVPSKPFSRSSSDSKLKEKLDALPKRRMEKKKKSTTKKSSKKKSDKELFPFLKEEQTNDLFDCSIFALPGADEPESSEIVSKTPSLRRQTLRKSGKSSKPAAKRETIVSPVTRTSVLQAPTSRERKFVTKLEKQKISKLRRATIVGALEGHDLDSLHLDLPNCEF